jgi:hypothetical protein
MADLYIYYGVPEAHAALLVPRVRAMQAQLRDGHAVLGELKRRPESRHGVQTWMEIYPAIPPGFELALDAAVQHAALSELIDGQRHTEVFTDLSTCA